MSMQTAAVTGGLTGIAVGTLVGGLAWSRVAGMTVVEMVATVLYWGLAGTLLGVVAVLLTSWRPRWLWRSLTVMVCLVVFWILADLFNALLTRRCYDNWEASIARSSNGVRAGCDVFQEGEGSTALLFVHGFADSPGVFLPMVEVLAKKGYACHTLRLPGFAEPFPRYAACTASAWRHALAEELGELRRNHNYKTVIVVAHSLGGAVTLDYLTDYPDLADGVVLLAPLLEVSQQRSPLLTPERWFHLLDRTLIFTDRIAMLLPPDVHDPKALAQMKEDRFTPRTVYREVFHLLDRSRHRRNQFALPLLLVVSPTDQIIDTPTAEQFFHDCAATNKTLKRMEQAGHVLPIDTGWEQIVEDIDLFARGLADTTPKK